MASGRARRAAATMRCWSTSGDVDEVWPERVVVPLRAHPHVQDEVAGRAVLAHEIDQHVPVGAHPSVDRRRPPGAAQATDRFGVVLDILDTGSDGPGVNLGHVRTLRGASLDKGIGDGREGLTPLQGNGTLSVLVLDDVGVRYGSVSTWSDSAGHVTASSKAVR